MSIETLNAIRPVWRKFHVKNAWIFGSRARNADSEGSDWDFLVEFSERPGFTTFMGLKCALEDVLGTKVDVLSLRAAKKTFLECIRKDLVNVS